MLREEHVDELKEVSNYLYCQLGVDRGEIHTECVCGCAMATKEKPFHAIHC